MRRHRLEGAGVPSTPGPSTTSSGASSRYATAAGAASASAKASRAPDDPAVARLATHTSDIAEYIVGIARREGLAGGMTALDGAVALHHACHARAQNIGAKSAVMLRMIPDCNVLLMRRCSGHGGAWGVMKDNYDVGMKVGEAVMRQTAESGRPYLASECPLAGAHIARGMERFVDGERPPPTRACHPIELLAMSYGIDL